MGARICVLVVVWAVGEGMLGEAPIAVLLHVKLSVYASGVASPGIVWASRGVHTRVQKMGARICVLVVVWAVGEGMLGEAPIAVLLHVKLSVYASGVASPGIV